jgi:ADP-ribose pyrophosphatase YjhB (NUDIX family)
MIENTACVIVQDKGGRILLVKRGNRTYHGQWCIPGGHSENNETPAQTAQREAKEEIGNVKVERRPFLIFAHNWPADSHIKKSHQHKCHVFIAKITGELKAGDDAVELGWFTPEEAKKLKITKYTRTVLNRLDLRSD